MDQQAEAVLRDWYWTQKQKDRDIEMFEALKKLGLYNYGISEYTRPTLYEISSRIIHWVMHFSHYSLHCSVSKYNPDFEKGFSVFYYDGLHCTINIWPLQIAWVC